MYLAIFLLPIIILLNGFLFGKLFKRYKPNLNNYFTTCLGTISFLGILGLMILPLLLFVVRLNDFFILFLVYQSILAIIYIFNWRWMFLTYRIKWKQFLVFSLVLIMVSLGWLLSQNLSSLHFNYDIDINLLNHLNQVNLVDADKIIMFSPNINYLNFPFISSLLMLAIYMFQVGDIEQIIIFLSTFQFILFAIFVSLVIVGIFYNRKMIFSSIVFLIFIALALSIIMNTFIKFSWIIIFTLLLIAIHFNAKEINNNRMTIIIINLISFAGITFNTNFIVVALITNLIMLFMSYLNKIPNATNYNIMILFTSLIGFSISFNNEYYINLIFLIVLFVFYTFYFLFGALNSTKKFIVRMDNFLYLKMKFIIVLLALVILLASIIVFITQDAFQLFLNPWIIDANDIAIGSSDVSVVNNMFLVTNIMFWFINVGIFLISMIINNSLFSRKIKFSKKFNHKYSISYNFIFLMILTVWNPFFTNIMNKLITSQLLSFNFYLFPLFWVVAMAIVFASVNKICLQPKFAISNLNITSIILLVSGWFVAFNNVA